MSPLDSFIEDELEELKELTEKLKDIEGLKEKGLCEKCYMYPSIVYKMAENYYNLLIRYEASEQLWYTKTEIGKDCNGCDNTKELTDLKNIIQETKIKISDIIR